MSDERDFDVAIIGGGIVGMATAAALLQDGRHPLVVLEAEKDLAAHQTGRNSGVIHSGIYYKPGSLKAKLCAEGREAMFRFCEERGIKHERCGKVIVATRDEELPQLEILEKRGIENGLTPRRMTREEIQEREPHVACVAGLEIKETGIVRFATVLEELAKVVAERGGEVRKASRVVGIKREASVTILETESGVVRTRNLVNCAGLQCDRIARMAGADPKVAIIPFRGEYYDLVPSRRSLCRHLIYPVPDPRFPFLGVHLTRATDDSVEAGPNAVLALRREGYDWSAISPRDIVGMLGYGGFWKMARRHYRTAFFEVHRSLVKSAFVRAVQTLVPEVKSEDLVVGRAGVRAQAVEPDGGLVDDFRFVESEAMLHVLNAPSPAATASLAIGRYIASACKGVFRD